MISSTNTIGLDTEFVRIRTYYPKLCLVQISSNLGTGCIDCLQENNLKKVWQLIKESVPLEKSFGDASISQKHCNFFVNKGNAKFEDMKKLINFVSESVFKKTGIKLETEIKILE